MIESCLIKNKASHNRVNLLKRGVKKGALLLSAYCIASTSLALHFEPSDDFSIDIDTTLTYGSMWRIEEMHDNKKGFIRDLSDLDAKSYLGHPNEWRNNPDGYQTDLNFLEMIEVVNGDDGNRNFDKGDLVSSRVSAITDMDFNYNNVGLFLRTQIFYDSVYFEETSWDGEGFDHYEGEGYISEGLPTPPGWFPGPKGAGNCPNSTPPSAEHDVCGYAGPESINNLMAAGEYMQTGRISDPSHFSEAAKDTHGFNARFLDAYVYSSFELGEHLLDLRIGRQVISWGESLMLQGGISFAQNRIDAAAATSPGVELKEIFLPTGSVYAQLDITNSLTIEAYWMYEWLPSELMATGSYFSTQDFIEGSDIFLTNTGMADDCMFSQFYERSQTNGPFSCGVFEQTGPGAITGIEHWISVSNNSNGMKRAETVTPDNEADQFGLAARYLLENGSEFGFYFMRYHDRFPSVWAMNNGAEEYYEPVVPFGPSTADVNGFNTRYYTLEYKEAIRMYGLTLNTVIGDVQMGFELTYRPNQPVVPSCTPESINNGSVTDKTSTDGGGPEDLRRWGLSYESSCKDPSLPFMMAGLEVIGDPDNLDEFDTVLSDRLLSWPTRAEVFTANIGTTMVIPPTPLWDTGILVAEIGGVYVGGFEDDDLKISTLGSFTKKAFGVSGIFLPEWKNVFEGVDLTMPVFVNYTIDGSFAYYNYADKGLWYSVGLNAVYLSNTTMGVTYSSFHGANQMWRDRDNIAFNVKYTF